MNSIKQNNNVEKTSNICLDIKPFNKFFYRSCFYNSLLSILSSYNKDICHLLLNDEIQYQFKSKMSNKYLGIQYKAIQPIDALLKSFRMDIQYSHNRYDLVKKLVSNINQNRPVIIWVDYFYLPYRTDTFQKIHWGETILIIGYNLQAEKIMIIDQLEKVRLNYQIIEISFSDIETAFEKMFEFQQGSEIDIVPFISFGNVDSLAQSYANENVKIYKETMSLNYNSYMENINLIHRYSDLFKGLDPMNNQMIESIGEGINEIVQAKEADLFRISSLFSSGDNILKSLECIVNTWIKIRGIYFKSCYTNSLNEECIIKIQNYLMDVFTMESQYLNEAANI